MPPKPKKSEPLKPDYRASSDSTDLHRYRISTQHFIPHSVPQTHIKKNMLSGRKPTERKPLQKPKPCTRRYRGIKKRLTDRMPAILTKAGIKGRDNRPLYPKIIRLIIASSFCAISSGLSTNPSSIHRVNTASTPPAIK